MSDISKLNDWDRLGICWADEGWVAVNYFKAPYSIPKLKKMGLVETTITTGRMGIHVISTEMVRLTPAGMDAKAEIEVSGFDKFAPIKRTA